ncbi:putative endoglucanase E1 [Halenospora varia]|nr:putative endoglucanase E1 [Halenospora varia]
MRLSTLLPLALTTSALAATIPNAESSSKKRASWPYGPFVSSGRYIHNSQGENVTYVGVNWPGAADAMIPEGLQYQPISKIVSDIKSLGMNVIRLTFAIEMNALGTANGLAVVNKIIAKNPTFTQSTTRVQVFDAVAAECKKQGIYVHLDNHISKGEWCCSLTDGNGWFGDTYFDVAKWKRGLEFMAKRGSSWGNLMSIGLRNEPRDTSNNAAVSATYNWETWYTHMTSAASVVHSANSDVLIFFSGLNYDTTLAPITLGSDLGSGSKFIASSFPYANKIVLELHNYQTTATSCSSITSGLYNGGYNAMDTSNTAVKNILPVVMTEWGHDETNSEYAGVYATWGWMVWALGGSYYIREGTQDSDETWGLYNHNWTAWRSEPAIAAIKSMVTATL